MIFTPDKGFSGKKLKILGRGIDSVAFQDGTTALQVYDTERHNPSVPEHVERLAAYQTYTNRFAQQLKTTALKNAPVFARLSIAHIDKTGTNYFSVNAKPVRALYAVKPYADGIPCDILSSHKLPPRHEHTFLELTKHIVPLCTQALKPHGYSGYLCKVNIKAQPPLRANSPWNIVITDLEGDLTRAALYK